MARWTRRSPEGSTATPVGARVSPARAREYIPVARVSEVLPGAVKMARADNRWYAVANVEGQFYVVDNACPHQGGPLGRGRLEGAVLECPWHQWHWSLVTGRSVWPVTDWRVRSYPTRVENGLILIPRL